MKCTWRIGPIVTVVLWRGCGRWGKMESDLRRKEVWEDGRGICLEDEVGVWV